ncbi:hypothetical protein OEZ86_013008 [Tetradesmus obliquus]|nr:hypothetical protein OEZ86_013008 [Tetradesmus obliquus]
MRLLLLEDSLQEVSSAMANKAAAGDMQELSAHVERLGSRLASTAHSLSSLSSSSSRRLEEQAGSLMRVTASLAVMDDRPTSEEVHEMLQRTLADAHGAASATAAAASSAAVRPLQQQLEGLSEALDKAKGQLQATQRELECVKEEQAASQCDAGRVAALDSKLRLLAAEVDRLHEQAEAAAQAREKIRAAVSAAEASFATHSSSCADELRNELAETAGQAQAEHAGRFAALEKAAAAQATAVGELAGLVADLPSKQGIREAVLGAAQATMELLLAEHKREEQGRWEVGEVQLQLLGKADKVELEQQLLALRHALQDSVQGAVTRDDFEDRMSRKLDVDTFLATVAARQKAAREREQARERQRAGGS